MASFARRRSRHDSTVSFTYFQESTETPEWFDEEAVADESEVEEGFTRDEDVEEAYPRSSFSHLDHTRSRSSVEHPLLRRETSGRNEYRGPPSGGNVSQKVYIVTEDLTAVIAGFSTSIMGSVAYLAICILTGGLGYLVFRWVPRWRIKLVGYPEPLYRCQWVAIEVRTIKYAF